MDFGGWLGEKRNGEGIQLVGSSWAKKLIVLKLKICGVVVQLFVHMFCQFEVVE